jgi:hypothetical protein
MTHRDGWLGAADGTRLYHEIFNEPEQAMVLDDLVAWLAERAAPARPRAEAAAR